MELWIWIDNPANRNTYSLLVSAGILIDLSIISSSNFVTCSVESLCKMHPNLYQHLKQLGMMLMSIFPWCAHRSLPSFGIQPMFHAHMLHDDEQLAWHLPVWMGSQGLSPHIKYCQMCSCHCLVIRFTCERRCNDRIDGTSANVQWYITTHVTFVSLKCFRINALQKTPSDWSLRGPITLATAWWQGLQWLLEQLVFISHLREQKGRKH